MKKLSFYILGLVFFLSLAQAFSNCKVTNRLNGCWTYTTESSVFNLLLTQRGSTLTGSHCSTMLGGRKVDCGFDASDLSITAVINDPNFMTVDVKSYYSGSTGKATLKKISASQIEWRLIQEPAGEFYLPDQVILTKR